ncbi:Baculoviral IAP repeat-containing protein 7-A [Armadillidium vulgare]|nr:Baculoviral IAP repeat-containing protein 7-A [Armadillidium vulgare]
MNFSGSRTFKRTKSKKQIKIRKEKIGQN